MSDNHEIKVMMKAQQERFVNEINTLVESLERIEGHARALTANNLDLRAALRGTEDQRNIWEKK